MSKCSRILSQYDGLLPGTNVGEKLASLLADLLRQQPVNISIAVNACCHNYHCHNQTQRFICVHASHTHTHRVTHVRTHARTHTQSHASTHARTHAHKRARTHTHTQSHARMHTHTHTRARARTHARTHAQFILYSYPYAVTDCRVVKDPNLI